MSRRSNSNSTKNKSKKKTQRKLWAKSLAGVSPLPKAGPPKTKTYTQLKTEHKISSVVPTKIFPNAPSWEFMDTLRNLLILEIKWKLSNEKLIKDDMVRILVNHKKLLNIVNDSILEDNLYGKDYKGGKIFTDKEIDTYFKLFKRNITRNEIMTLSKSVFTNTN